MERKNLISLISLAASLLLIFFLLSPLWNSTKILRAEISHEQKELDSLEKLLIKTEELEQTYQGLKEQADKVLLALPEQEDLSFLLVQFENLSSVNGLLLESINFGSLNKAKEEVGFGFPSLNLEINLIGSYETFKNFISALDKSVRLMEIEKINLIAHQSVQEGTSLDVFEFIMGIKVYLLD
ncbi:MAG: type 4a pilus biogenesis protein PilO [Patescibacteria group bacterium]